MGRSYTLKRRAEQQAQTRLKIVEAAIALHGSVGPALTTVSMVAERAGVQRHTVYAHFPDERSLIFACSGLALERDPLPVADPWRAIESREKRLGTGIDAVYGWYERNASLAACVLRDAENHALTQEIVALRLGPNAAGWHAVLGAGLRPRQQALLHLALGFYTWRALARESGLTRQAAVDTMVQAILLLPKRK